jgi:tetratricopeptide (TPR) repeat protein
VQKTGALPTCFVTAALLLCLLLSVSARAQELPPQAAGRFQQAIDDLRAQNYAAAEELLKQLEAEFPQQPDIQEALAMALVSQGKAEAATPHFENVVRLRPDSARAHLNLGANYLHAGRIEDATTEFQKALKIDPDNPTLNYNLGSLYLAQRRFQDALPYLQQAYRQQPQMAGNAHQLALCYFFLGRHQEAAELLNKLAAGSGQPAEFFILLGLNDKALGDEGGAQSAFARARQALPSSAEAYESVGQMFFQLGLYAEAVPVLERAQQQYPDSHPIAYNLILAYQRAGETDKAYAAAQAALQQWPTADLHNLMGGICEQREDYIAAVNHLRRAVELEPSEQYIFDLGYEFLVHWTWESATSIFEYGLKRYPGSLRLWLGMGAADFAQGNFNRALEAFLGAARANPDSATAYQMLATAFPLSRDHTREAQQRFRRYYEKHPDDASANYYYGSSLGRPPDLKPSEAEIADAIRLLRRAISLDPNLADAHYELALLLSERGEWEEAVPSLEAAVRLKPDFVAAYYRLALGYQHVGRREEAKDMLARYQKMKKVEEDELAQRSDQTKRFILDLKQ